MLTKLICGFVIYGLSSSAGQQRPLVQDLSVFQLSAVEAYDISGAAQLRPSCAGGCGVRQMLTFPGR